MGFLTAKTASLPMASLLRLLLLTLAIGSLHGFSTASPRTSFSGAVPLGSAPGTAPPVCYDAACFASTTKPMCVDEKGNCKVPKDGKCGKTFTFCAVRAVRGPLYQRFV